MMRKLGPPIVTIICLGAAWQICAVSEWIDPLFFPRPTAIVSRLVALLGTWEIAHDVVTTTGRAAIALAAATLIGVPLGLLLGHYRRAYAYVESVIHALRSVPATALFPLAIFALGIRDATVIVLAFYPSALIMIVNAAAGVDEANRVRVHIANQLGIGRLRLFYDILLHEAMPSIARAVRTAASFVLAITFAVEILTGMNSGLGYKTFLFQSAYRTADTYALIAIAAVLGILFNAVVTAVERRCLRWLPETLRDYDD